MGVFINKNCNILSWAAFAVRQIAKKMFVAKLNKNNFVEGNYKQPAFSSSRTSLIFRFLDYIL